MQFICGIVKGVISSFNMECNVSAQCRQNVIFNNLLSLTSDNMTIGENTNASNIVYPYTFTINIISTNN